ncbi:MAG TPA: FtsW/RodA/SpoVE family cell cycle protein [Erysipelotrichaceae bacterium]|jgi:cell division protein FtsW|nr:FtsW/RodA/SpoVE family cell cycle protein [Erysipelotrichaceae bacterium]HCY07087.1 FtsW/RodA/SpoVE family cell cycle protein [Erysipelotrichaceae bacterium]
MLELHRGLNLMRRKRMFNPIRMPYSSDKVINFCITVLVFFGLIMITSASMGIAVGDNPYLIKTVIKQIIFSIGGYIAMVFMAKQFKFHILKRDVMLLIIVTGILLLVPLAFDAVSGAKAWIRLPFPGIEVTIQPSEFAKISIICIIAAYMGDLTSYFDRPTDIVKVPITASLFYVFLVIVLQGDFGSGAVMFAIAAICFLIPKHPQIKKYQVILFGFILLGIVSVLFVLSPVGEGLVELLPLQRFQKNRILSSINPFVDRYDTGYQLINGLISFASGGFWGVGFGNSVRKYTNFPAANTDFILAIVVEELGFFGFLIIFGCYFFIIIRLFKYAFLIKSEKGQIVLVGTAMYILIHFVLNVGGVTGLIPLTGVPLLMISAGGSSTMSMMMAIGLSQAVISQYNTGLLK